MSKKHYVKIAAIIRGQRPLASRDDSAHYVGRAVIDAANFTLDSIAQNLAHAFAQDNECFDGARFLDACK